MAVIENFSHDKPEEHKVEEYLQSIFKPLNLMPAILFCAKYKIKNNSIIPISRIYCFVSVFGTFAILSVCFYCYFLFTDIFRVEKIDNFVNFIKIYNFILQLVGGTLDFFTNIYHKQDNVRLVLKIQSVHKIIRINKRCFKHFIINNWFYIIAINCFHIYWIIFYYFAFADFRIENILTSYFCIRFDASVVYASRVIKLLRQSLSVWLEDVLKTGFDEELERQCYWNSTWRAYLEILEVYQMIEKVFHHMILFYFVHSVSSALLDILTRIELNDEEKYKDNVKYAVLSFITLSWVLKNLLLQISLSVENEKFYSTMAEVRSTCIKFAASPKCSEYQRNICKDIQRLEEASFKRMNACGLIIIDATVPLRLIGLISTYTIVILQFKFL